MAFVHLNVYLGNARKHWRSLVIGIQIWALMCQNHVEIVGAIQGNVRTVCLKVANSVYIRTKIIMFRHYIMLKSPQTKSYRQKQLNCGIGGLDNGYC